MRGLFRLTLLIAGLTAAPAIAADQFDLVCKGQQKVTPDGAATPVAAHYRVDVTAGKWCRDQWCAAPDTIAAANAGRIAFKSHAKANDQDELIDESFDRSSGKWVDRYVGPYPPGEYSSTEGSCEIAAFSGFPRP